MSKHYPGELSDKEWDLISPLFVRQHIKNRGRKNAGRKPKYGARRMLNAIFYVLREGCAWHLLSHDFPPWQTVYSQFQRWQYVRVMPGKPHSPNPRQQKPYVSQMKNGKSLDKYGNVVDASDPAAHIPFEEFQYKDLL